jgi:flotillin
MEPILLVAFVGTFFIVLLGVGVALWRFHRTVPAGQALVIKRASGYPVVSFSSALVLPFVHSVEILDITMKTVLVERTGRAGLHSKDDVRTDVKARFYLRVRVTTEDVLNVAQTFGCAEVGRAGFVQELFAPKFAESLRAVIARLDFDEMARDRTELVDRTIEVIGRDLSGFSLEDVVVESFERTPIEDLDPDNIRDAEAMRKMAAARAEAAQAAGAACLHCGRKAVANESS